MNVISKQRGFTLIELLVVISIIGMLASDAQKIYAEGRLRHPLAKAR